MTHDEIAPFLDKCVTVSLATGDTFQGFLRAQEPAYQVDAGSSQTSIETPESIEKIELLLT